MKHKLISSATMPCNIKAAVKQNSPVDKKIQFTFFSFLVFLVGVPATQVINLVGELYVTELLLPVLAAVIILSGKSLVTREKIYWQFVIAGCFLFLGYVISDLVAGTESSKYFRAWGRNFLLIIDMLSLAIIVGSDRRLLWWFLMGLVVGSIGQLVLTGVPISDWKFGYGRSFILLIILVGFLFPKRTTMFGMVGIGIVSIFFDSRSLGAFSFIVAGIIFLRINKPDGLKISAAVATRIVILGTLVAALLLTFLNMTQEEQGARRSWSNIMRFAAIEISITAISESPILGYGSWGHGTEKFANQLYDKIAYDLVKAGKTDMRRGDDFLSHSQILQVWMEGGVFAAAFFIFFGYQLFIGLKSTTFTRHLDSYTPLYFFLLLQSAWHLFMSPYSGSHRIMIALSIAILCSLKLENSKK